MNTKKLKISRKSIVTFSVFIIIAIIFWFLNAMDLEYTTKINYKVEFIDFPEDARPASEMPEELKVTVKAYGYNLIGKTKSKHPIKISVKQYAQKDKNDKSKLILSTNLLSDHFFADEEDISIISITPETVVFTVEELFTKKVPIKGNFKYTCKPLYMKSDNIILSPDSVIVSGTEEALKKISYAETNHLQFKDLYDTLKTNCKLKTIKGVRFSVETTKLTIPIEKYTENSENIHLKIKNCPDSLNLITFPDEIKVTYKVALSKYNLIRKKDFSLSVDYNDVIRNHPDRLNVTVETCPEFIESLQLSPEVVEYIPEKKQ